MSLKCGCINALHNILHNLFYLHRNLILALILCFNQQPNFFLLAEVTNIKVYIVFVYEPRKHLRWRALQK